MYPNLQRYLQSHSQMEPVDLIKYCYQSVLGPGHMAPDRQTAAARVREELAACGRPDFYLPDFERLEGGAARLDIGCGLRPESVAGLFCLTAEKWPLRLKGYRQVLEMLRHLDVRACLPFPAADLDRAIEDWEAQRWPAVSHSQRYHQFYRANYRVIYEKYLPFLEAIQTLESLPRPAVVAIDGRCGSGKSTLAEVLAYIFGAQVVHMDDFFLPFEQKTPQRLARPGGNVHYERFNQEVTPLLRSGQAISHGVYDCASGTILRRRLILPSRLLLVEGSYSQSPDIGFDFDLRIFVTTDPDTQLARITARDPDMAEAFRTRWIPMEEQYFAAFDIQRRADLVVRT